MPYPIAPSILSEIYNLPIDSNADPLSQQIKGGVEQNSTTGMINVVGSDRTLEFWVKAADYATVYAFFDGLKGKPFQYQGEAYRVKSLNWVANSFPLWQLRISVSQVFNPG